MTPLHRHQIAWLARSAWQRLLERRWDSVARECLEHWAEHGLPLVVTRQPPQEHGSNDELALGLSAPQRWARRRIALSVQRTDVLYFDEFPRLDQIGSSLRSTTRAALRKLDTQLRAAGAIARVYGSHGWQHFTGLDHVRRGSDLDVWVAVSDVGRADAVAAALQGFCCTGLRLDGELVFDDDTAVAWREWHAWRARRARALLVKRLAGAALATPDECKSIFSFTTVTA